MLCLKFDFIVLFDFNNYGRNDQDLPRKVRGHHKTLPVRDFLPDNLNHFDGPVVDGSVPRDTLFSMGVDGTNYQLVQSGISYLFIYESCSNCPGGLLHCHLGGSNGNMYRIDTSETYK